MMQGELVSFFVQADPEHNWYKVEYNYSEAESYTAYYDMTTEEMIR